MLHEKDLKMATFVTKGFMEPNSVGHVIHVVKFDWSVNLVTGDLQHLNKRSFFKIMFWVQNPK